MTLIVAVPDAYIFATLIAGHAPVLWAAAWWVPTAVIMGFLVSLLGRYRLGRLRAFFALFSLISVPKLAFAVFALLGQVTGLHCQGIAVGLCAVAAVLLAVLYGATLGCSKLKVNNYDLDYDDLPPECDGLRLVQISDFHLGTYGHSNRFVGKVVDTVLGLKPDLIVFTGDLINVDEHEVTPHTHELQRLKAPLGVYSIMGNHDYNGNVTALEDYERNTLGWDLLLNENRVLSRSTAPGSNVASAPVYLIGVQNTSYAVFVSRGNLRQAMQGVPAGAFKILLTHDPNHWRHEVVPRTSIQLTLSGHTHAGQLRIGNWSPIQYTYPEWGGLYNDAQHGLGGSGKRMLLVSSGLGGTNHFRLGARPEVNLVILHRKK